ncbi:MAG: hypothetical protein EU532_03055 [Promethearchaeota archaeon]|nr:MAG: hypothetical protein EU532_03055 [Candidatus Lokiarchaeota archaeon]
MVIRESGILFRGFTLVFARYHQTSDDKIDKDLRSALLTALLNFAESAFAKDTIEYFEMKRFAISFVESKIRSEDDPETEPIIAYVILDKEKKMDKHLSKVVLPALKEALRQFKEQFEGKNLSEISQFQNFKTKLDEIFGSETKTIDERLKGTLF